MSLLQNLKVWKGKKSQKAKWQKAVEKILKSVNHDFGGLLFKVFWAHMLKYWNSEKTDFHLTLQETVSHNLLYLQQWDLEKSDALLLFWGIVLRQRTNLCSPRKYV